MFAGGVTLTELRVPAAVAAGVQSGVVLDCLYTLLPDPVGLVVAWYFNNSARPVYQWIPGRKPLSIGVFRHRVNLDYKATDDNETMYRALHIINPTVELSGDYRCVVSTYHDEDFMIKRMIVYCEYARFPVTYRSERVRRLFAVRLRRVEPIFCENIVRKYSRVEGGEGGDFGSTF